MSLQKLFLPPDEAQIQAIKTALNEDTERHENNLTLLEQWMQCQPHFPKNYDKNMLSGFLRGCKHDMEAAKRKIETHFACKTKMDFLFTMRELNEMETRCNDNFIKVLMPRLTDEGYRIIVLALKNSDPSDFDFKTYIVTLLRYGMLCQYRDTMIAGHVYIVDCSNFTAAHMPKYVVPSIRHVAYLMQDAFAFRIRALYYVNANAIADNAISIWRLLLKEKIKNRIRVDRGISILKEKLPLHCVPKDLGGTERSMDELADAWKDCLYEEDGYLKQQYEQKMVGVIPERLDFDFDEDWGLPGSFRQLNID